MKKIRRITVFLMVISMVLSSNALGVLAEDIKVEANQNNTDDNTTQNDLEIAENTIVDKQSNKEEQLSEENDKEDISSKVSEKQKAFEYIYVDEETVNIPEEQNIVVVFADSEMILEKATLYYSSVERGEILELTAANIVDNTVLFTKEYSDVSEAGTYQLDSIAYKITDQEEVINVRFADQAVEATYTVTTESEEDEVGESTLVAGERTPEVTVYSVDESGNAIEESAEETEDIESVVESTLEIADEEGIAEVEQNVSVFSRERTGEQSEKLVVMLCAGHDATHAGAQANGLSEEKLTYKVVQYCKEELEQYSGVTVYLSRDTIECAYPGKNVSYCRSQRVKDAAALGVDIFIDFHFNAGGGSGAEIYYPNNSFSTAIHQEGKNLAEQMIVQLEALGLYNRGAKTKDCTDNVRDENGNLGDYYTTIALSKEYNMAGIIIEHAYIDNANDAAKLKNESFLKQLGVADATGIAKAYNLTKGTDAPTEAETTIQYSTHVQDIGWQSFVNEGKLAGTTGRNLQVEAIKIKLSNASYEGNIEYSAHVQDIGWQSFVKNGAISGTTGKNKQMEAVKIRLTGEMVNQYDIYYRVHTSEFGWLGWAKNGEAAGSEGYARQIEAIEIQLVDKGGSAPGSTAKAFISKNGSTNTSTTNKNVTVKYLAHVENIGWQSQVINGGLAGTTGRNLQLEALKITLPDKPYEGSVQYSTHVQDIGWQEYVRDGATAGTTGKNKAVEAVKIKLTGEMANKYDIYYRVHSSEFGWLGWARNGEAAGSEGYARQAEALEIKLVEKGSSAPGTTKNCFYKK